MFEQRHDCPEAQIFLVLQIVEQSMANLGSCSDLSSLSVMVCRVHPPGSFFARFHRISDRGREMNISVKIFGERGYQLMPDTEDSTFLERTSQQVCDIRVACKGLCGERRRILEPS